ncbi:MAG: hypothetical protein AAB393_03095 [Bacteroidota bacterium]
MTLKASELPDYAKEHLLSQIQDHIGSVEYDRMVDAIGRDGVVDLFLEVMSGSGSRAREGPWRKAWEAVWPGFKESWWWWLLVGLSGGWAGIIT